MKIKMSCAMFVLTAVYFNTIECGSLKKSFSKGDSQTEEASDSSNGGSSSTHESSSSTGSSGTEPISDFGSSSSSSDSASGSSSSSSQSTSAPTSASAPAPAASSGPTQPVVGDPVVAIIGTGPTRKEFKRSDVLALIGSLPAQITQSMPPERLFDMLRDQLIFSYNMQQQARKAGLDKTKEYLDQVEKTKEELLTRTYMMRELGPKTENETELKKQYQLYLKTFSQGLECELYHIMVSDEKTANDVLKKLGDGGKFEDLAKEFSLAQSKSNGGSEGWVPLNNLPPELKEPLALLTTGQYTKTAVKTQHGYHIFMKRNERTSKPEKYEDALPRLKQMILQDELRKLQDRLEKMNQVVRFKEDGKTPATATS